MSELRERLAEMVDVAEWSELTIHALSGRVVIVSGELALVDVGVALANDDKASFTRWIEDGLLYKPLEAEIDERNRTERHYQALIVRPFVLVHDRGLKAQEA